MITHIIAFSLSFCAIFMKGFSQQNVIYRRKMLIMPTSWLLGAAEMFTAGMFVDTYLNRSVTESIILAIVIGTGGGLGCILSLDFHGWVTKKIYKWDKEKT